MASSTALCRQVCGAAASRRKVCIEHWIDVHRAGASFTAQGVSDVFTAANIESLPRASIKSWCQTWLEAKSIEAEETTHLRYKRVIERFTDFLGDAKSKRDLATLQASDVARFRDREAKELSRSTANLGVKVLRVCLGEAVRQGLLTMNPAVRVKIIKSTLESRRRPFTFAEIKRILKTCQHDVEWRGLVLFGFYLGQRSATWQNSRGVRSISRPARLHSQRARPDGESCSHSCSR